MSIRPVGFYIHQSIWTIQICWRRTASLLLKGIRNFISKWSMRSRWGPSNVSSKRGRVALWAPRQVTPRDNPEGQWKHEFVRRLRMYPHALRDQNAYYSPDKKAILFGYFPVRTNDARNTPGTTVFACLSHDVIAH